MTSAAEVVATARRAFASGITRPVEWRVEQLQKLHDLLTEKQDALIKALMDDFRKPAFETIVLEITVVKNDIVYALNNIHSWVKPSYVAKNLVQKFDSIYTQAEPLGVTLIMGAWNYPVILIFQPLIGAIAAGNCAIIKPSEISSASADLYTKLIPKYIDENCFQVYNGGVEETTQLLEERFDHIFFTGSSRIGKIVMSAAAKHLTPVILELGGKSPCYVHDDSDLGIVANRVLWGKFINCGQTCIAADYILCHEKVIDKFIEKLKTVLIKMYGNNPKDSPDFARIINDRSFERLSKIMDSMPEGKVAVGGGRDADERYIAPTIYRDVSMDDSIMSSELFGPLLPIISISGPDEAIRVINSQEKPLALYIFAKSNQVADLILNNTSSGGVTVNDLLMHASSSNVPFGGVGTSGFGAYHGKHSFDTFSHQRPIWRRKQNMESLVAGRYPPYTSQNLSMMQWLLTEKKGGYCNIL